MPNFFFLSMEIILHCPPAEKIAHRCLNEKCTLQLLLAWALVVQPCTKLQAKAPLGQQGISRLMWESQAGDGLNTMEMSTRYFWTQASRGAVAAHWAGGLNLRRVRRWSSKGAAQGCFSCKQKPARPFCAGSLQTGTPWGFPFVLVMALTSCPAPLWCWGKFPAPLCSLRTCSSMAYLTHWSKFMDLLLFSTQRGESVIGQACALCWPGMQSVCGVITFLACLAFFIQASFWNMHLQILLSPGNLINMMDGCQNSSGPLKLICEVYYIMSGPPAPQVVSLLVQNSYFILSFCSSWRGAGRSIQSIWWRKRGLSSQLKGTQTPLLLGL